MILHLHTTKYLCKIRYIFNQNPSTVAERKIQKTFFHATQVLDFTGSLFLQNSLKIFQNLVHVDLYKYSYSVQQRKKFITCGYCSLAE